MDNKFKNSLAKYRENVQRLSQPEPAAASDHCTRGCGRGRPSRSTEAD